MGQNLEDIRFDGELFLEDVLEKLHKKMDELKEDLTAGEQEIRQMHDYYWENYTEMDQYGYEDYDNQQALLHQVNANQEKLRMQQRIARLMDDPFLDEWISSMMEKTNRSHFILESEILRRKRVCVR